MIDDQTNTTDGHTTASAGYLTKRACVCVCNFCFDDNFVFRFDRAQSDADIRRVKADLLKGKSTAAVAVRKDVTNNKQQQQQQQQSVLAGGESTTVPSHVDAKCVAEVKRLRSENAILKDANKQLEEKNTVSSLIKQKT